MHLIMRREVGSYSYAGTGYANPHAVTSVGGTTYTYDNNGNVTAIGSLDYTWDWRNRLSSAERSGGGVTTYGYDHTGQRVFQATGSATTSYPSRYYNVASSSLTATTTKHIFSPDGTLLATVVGSGVANASTTHLHPDHLGGTNVVTDEDGEVVQTLDYYPYGSQRIATGAFSEQRRFIGEEVDGDTEFSYLNARYYEGSRGQFLSQDPVFLLIGDPNGNRVRAQKEWIQLLADPQGLNSYSYGLNNPLRFEDPSGEQAVETFLGYQIFHFVVFSAFTAFLQSIDRELLENLERNSAPQSEIDEVKARIESRTASYVVGSGASAAAPGPANVYDYLGVAGEMYRVRSGYGGSIKTVSDLGGTFRYESTPPTLSSTVYKFGSNVFECIDCSSAAGSGQTNPSTRSYATPSGTKVDAWAVVRAAISAYYTAGGK